MSAFVRLTSCLPLLALAGCAPSESPPDPVAWSVADSAGIAVVVNRLEGIPYRAWAVEETPLLSIGGLDAPASQQLYRVNGATRLPDGRLAVSSAGTFDVRIYDSQGALLATFGAEGDGPEEFRDPVLVGRRGADTLVVFDATLSRLSWIHPVDGFLGSAPVRWSGKGFPIGRGLLADGSLLIGGGMTFSSDEGFPTGVIRPLSTFGWVGRDGVETRLGDFPAAEMYARASDGGFMARGLPFARVTLAAPALEGAWLGIGDSWELRQFGATGSLLRVVRLDGPSRPVTPGDRAAYVEEQVAEASTDNEARQLRTLLAEMPFPGAFPPYQALATDASGYLWVQDYRAPSDGAPSWTVLDSEGRAVARLTTPPRTRLLEIGPDYLLAQSLGEMEVESLTLWRLRRGGLAPPTP